MATVNVLELLSCILVFCLIPLSLILLFVPSPWESNGRSVPFPRRTFYFVWISSLVFAVGSLIQFGAWVAQTTTGTSSLEDLYTAQRVIADLVRLCLQIYMSLYILLTRPVGYAFVVSMSIVLVSTASTVTTVLNDANVTGVVVVPALARNLLLMTSVALPLPVLLYQAVAGLGSNDDSFSALVAFLSIFAQLQGIVYAVFAFLHGNEDAFRLVQTIFMILWISALLFLSHYLAFARSSDLESTYLPTHIAGMGYQNSAAVSPLTVSPTRRSRKSAGHKFSQSKDVRPSSAKSASSQTPFFGDEIAQPRPMLVTLPSRIDVHMDYEGSLVSDLMRLEVESSLATNPMEVPIPPSSFVPFLSRQVSATTLTTPRCTPPATPVGSPPPPPMWPIVNNASSAAHFHGEIRRPLSADDTRPTGYSTEASRHRHAASMPWGVGEQAHPLPSNSVTWTPRVREPSPSPEKIWSLPKDTPLMSDRTDSPLSFVQPPDNSPSVYSQLSEVDHS